MADQTPPVAVLLDAGGVFLLPDHARILGAFARSEVAVDAARLDDAHYAGAARFTTLLDAETDWNACWNEYLVGYVEFLDVAADASANSLSRWRCSSADASAATSRNST